ncbi:MAG: tetraacyldisaccharide 4'-kinase [Prevotella sp.]|nr:tetraacyldisaccharide 4'-kinase [Prevotella sp.]
MEGDFIKINKLLLPFSWLYGLGVGFRNFLFDMRVLKSRSFDVPVISVGNITVGGTGKTPHVEYLVRLLQKKLRVAVLSRGYKRKTRGFVLADDSTTVAQIGDEPYQMKQKFGNVTVAVDKKRVHGIEQLTSQDTNLDVVLLDDAFQHRYVKPGINILLVDYHRLIIYDKLLPAGRLREPLSGKNRADIVIVTKCPKDLKPMDYRVITKAMDLFPYQHLYFTTLNYGKMYPLYNNIKGMRAIEQIGADEHVLLLTGIASPKQLQIDLAPYASQLTTLTFPDHHNFRKKDIRRLNELFEKMPAPKCIITTEKDAARLKTNGNGLSEEVRKSIYALPVEVQFMQEQEASFNENIIGYIRKNSRNSILTKAKDGQKAKRDSHPSESNPRTISFRNN